VIDGWMRETEVSISAIQCWTALEEYFGVVAVHGDEHDEATTAYRARARSISPE